MTDRTVTVAEAQVVWGYQRAALLRTCTVTRTDGVWSLTGSVVEAQASRLSRRPLKLMVKVQSGFWAWPIDTLQITDGTLHAALGPKE